MDGGESCKSSTFLTCIVNACIVSSHVGNSFEERQEKNDTGAIPEEVLPFIFVRPSGLVGKLHIC